MKIPDAIFFLSDFGGGGAQRTLINLAGAMPKDEMKVELVVADSSGPAGSWLPPGLPCHDLAGRRMAQSIPSLAKFIKYRKPDVVLSTMLHANIATMLAGRMAGSGPAIVLRETNSHRAQPKLGGFFRWLGAIAYRQADLVVALSEGVRRELIEDMILDADRTTTIANPVEVMEIRKQVAAARRRRSPVSPGPGAPCIVSVGRLVHQKAYDVLIDALADYLPGARLVLLGEGPDRASLRERADRRGMSDRLIMPGFVEDVHAYLAYADMFVLSSRWEGFGHVIVEAMAAGLPVVATDCPHGPRDIIEHEKSGLLVPCEDSDALGQAIRRVAKDPELAEKLAQCGSSEADQFQSVRIALRYAEALKGAIRRRSSSRGQHHADAAVT